MLKAIFGRQLKDTDLHKWTGVVIDSKTWAETHVSGGGGGGGYVSGGYGQSYSSSPVSSTVVTNNQFFLARDDGGEFSVTTSAAIPVRAGARMVVYGFQVNLRKNFKNFVAYGNVQTEQFALQPALGPIFNRILPKPFLGGIVVSIICGVFLAVVTGNLFDTEQLSASLTLAGMFVFIPAWIGLFIFRVLRLGRDQVST